MCQVWQDDTPDKTPSPKISSNCEWPISAGIGLPPIGPLDASKYSPLRQIYGTVCQCPHWSFVAGQQMNYVSPADLTGKKTIEDGVCSQCGAQPKLTGVMLDSVGGRMVSMFECECGKQSWTYEPKQARSVGH
jgi:hypothetical protein